MPRKTISRLREPKRFSVKAQDEESGRRPFRVIDRRSTSGYAASSNTLYSGATQTGDRTAVATLDRDQHRSITSLGRRNIMTLGRHLFANYPAVTGSLLEQAILPTEHWSPQFWGDDKDWGLQAEDWLFEWSKICDIAGWPYDYDTYVMGLILAELRDGDSATLLTENTDGYPMIQVIPSHRIRCNNYARVVENGRYSGRRIIDGVIVNDQRRPIAYRIWDEAFSEYEDISASNMFLSFLPVWQDQVRGLSTLASSVYDWMDLKDSRGFELLAQKASAALALIEENESGGIDTAKSVIKSAATFSDAEKQTLTEEKLSGGTVRYFRSNTGAKIAAHSYNRPGDSTQRYQADVIRDAMSSLGWSYWFTVDPTKPSGASMRIIVDKINRFIRWRQKMLRKACARIHGYAVAKAIKLGLLPFSEEWWKWEYQPSQEITADRKYDSDVDVQEYSNAFTTLKSACAKRGEYWEEVQDQWLREKFRKMARAKEIASEFGLGEEEANAVTGVQAQQPNEMNRPRREPLDDDSEDSDESEEEEEETNA